ncbi:DUF6920 family protein [Salipaludibacillus daqingensis]|uniref:DUF6920 family protein n=1 Tax=Salipaludibacillus daqingensis TaxID=3041001 RepID=UPI0024749ABF|nr:DUF6544 family protein [Salipaludibacillus daqingensis]
MKLVIIIVMALHGIIHLLGFLKGFNLAEINELTIPISRLQGILWLGAGLFFFISVSFLFFNHDLWWKNAIIAVILSQVLIFGAWGDAKMGSIANIFIVIAIIFAFAALRFDQQINKEVDVLLNQEENKTTVITEEMIDPLPEPVQKWLLNSGVIGKKLLTNISFKHQARMKLKPDQKNWYQATSGQYVTTQEPGFIWKVDIAMNPWMNVKGRDTFIDGKGDIQMKLASLLTVANVKNNQEADQSTMQRYLLELPWYPVGALSPYITWKEIDNMTAEATMTYKGLVGTAKFFFTEEGEYVKSSAWRYDTESDSYKECIGVAKEFQIINGVKIPTKVDVSYVLEDGLFTWYKAEIYELELQ